MPPAPCTFTIYSYLFARWHLFQHVGYLRHQQVDFWPFDLESGVRVTCDVGYFCANFSLHRLSVLELGPMYTTDRQTDVRQKHHLKPPPYLPNSPAQRMFTPARPASTNYRTNNSITPTTDYLPPFNYTTRSINQRQRTLPVNDDPSHQWKISCYLQPAEWNIKRKADEKQKSAKTEEWGKCEGLVTCWKRQWLQIHAWVHPG